MQNIYSAIMGFPKHSTTIKYRVEFTYIYALNVTSELQFIYCFKQYLLDQSNIYTIRVQYSAASVCLWRRWCSSIIWADLHFLEWLCRPTREWQSLPHLVQEKGVGCWGYLPRSFRLLLLSKAAVVSASSANFAPCLTVCLQDGRSSAMLSHESLSMLHRFMSLLQTSLKCSLGRPACREPSASSPYKRSLGMRHNTILQ